MLVGAVGAKNTGMLGALWDRFLVFAGVRSSDTLARQSLESLPASPACLRDNCTLPLLMSGGLETVWHLNSQ